MDLPSIVAGAAVPIALWVAQQIWAPDLLDRLRQRRTAEAQVETERRRHEREDAAIRNRLHAALIEEVQDMQRVFIKGVFPIGRWEELQSALKALVKTDDAARTLGADYREFYATVRSDRWTLGYVKNLLDKLPPDEDDSPNAKFRPYQHDAFVLQAVASQVAKFTDLLRVLGDDDAARRYGTSAEKALAMAESQLREPPRF